MRAPVIGQHHPQQLARIGLVVHDQHVRALEIERARARRAARPATGAGTPRARPRGRAGTP